MKRDMDLIRLLLLQQESGENSAGLDAWPPNVQAYHAGLLIDAKLVEGNIAEGGNGEIIAAAITRLTWAGHEFLDAARNDTIWIKIKGHAIKSGLALTFSALTEILRFEGRRQMQMHGLLP